MNFLKYIKKGKAREPKPLRIEGTSTVLTPEPDDAELAARALLESMRDGGRKKKAGSGNAAGRADAEGRDAGYYRSLSDRIREAHEAEAMAAMRYVAWCEQELPTAGMEKLCLMERGLYRHTDTAEREKGHLKARWQSCLAEVIIRQMETLTE